MSVSIEKKYTIERYQNLNPTADDGGTIRRFAWEQDTVEGQPIGQAKHIQLVDRPASSFASIKALTVIDPDEDLPKPEAPAKDEAEAE